MRLGKLFLLLCIFLSGCARNNPNSYEYAQLISDFRCKQEQVYCPDVEVIFPPILERLAFIQVVLERNPTIEAARQAWGAAIARYPQETSLADPLLSYQLAPQSVGSSLRYGQVIEFSQGIPFPGKLTLQGQIALAEARSIQEDYEWVKVELAQVASTLFDDFYVIERSIATNDKFLTLLKELKTSSESQYKVGNLSQQSPIQADLELSQMLYQKVQLETERRLILAKMNGLLHRPPDAFIPPPQDLSILVVEDYGNKVELREEALENRPDLRSLRMKLYGSESAIQLAKKQFYPDFDVMWSYDSRWDPVEYRQIAGIGLNLPIQIGKRKGLLDQTRAEFRRLEREYAYLVDLVLVEVEVEWERLLEAHKLLSLLKDTITPTANSDLAAVIAEFRVGNSSFVSVIEAEKSLRAIELQNYRLLAEVYRQRARLDQALGRIRGTN